MSTADPQLTCVGVGDFNGDSKADVLLRDAVGGLGIWFMNGATIIAAGPVGSTPLSAVSTGDYDGDRPPAAAITAASATELH